MRGYDKILTDGNVKRFADNVEMVCGLYRKNEFERTVNFMKKRVLCALMAAGMMTMALASCGGNDSGNSSASSSAPAGESSSSASASSAEGDVASSADSAIDMEGEPYTVRFLFLNQTEGESYNAVEKAVDELSMSEINMHTSLIPVTFGTMSSTIQMMLAANEPLDLFICANAAALPTYIESGYILNWADYLDQMPDVVEYFGEDLQYGNIGDFMSGIGLVKERAGTFGLVARSDILEEVGFTVEDFADVDANNPATLEGLDKLFAAVQEKYPNMTALAGQQGLTSYIGNYTDALGDGFGVLENMGQSTDVTNWYASEQCKGLVETAKRWFDAHYYSSDAATNQDTGETLLKAGNLFSYIVSIKPNTAAEKKAQCGYDVAIIPMNGSGNYTTNSYTRMMYCLANASESPEKAAAFYNWVFTSGEFVDLINWGIEGTDWVETAEGLAAFPEGVDASNAGYHNDFGWIYPNQTAGHAWDGNPVDIWDQYKEATANAVKSKAIGFTYDSTSVSDQVAACSAALEQYTKMLQFGTVSDVDATLAEFNAALEGAGLQMIIDEKQTQLDAWLAANGK